MITKFTTWFQSVLDAWKFHKFNKGYQWAWDKMLNGMAPETLQESMPANLKYVSQWDLGALAAVEEWHNTAPWERY